MNCQKAACVADRRQAQAAGAAHGSEATWWPRDSIIVMCPVPAAKWETGNKQLTEEFLLTARRVRQADFVHFIHTFFMKVHLS